MIERQARDLEVRVRVPVQVQIFLLKFNTLTLGGWGQTHSYVIFSKSIFYIRNRTFKWFGRDHIL